MTCRYEDPEWVLAVVAMVCCFAGAALALDSKEAVDRGLEKDSTNRIPPVVTNYVAPVAQPPLSTNAALPIMVEPDRPSKVKVSLPGAELQNAFTKIAAGKFSVSGKSRVLKIPEKEPRRKKSDDSWRRTLEFGVNTSKGNSDTLRYDGSIGASKETDKNFYWLKAGGRFGESEGQKDTENAYGEGKYERSLTERMYAGLDGHVFHDQIDALSYRFRVNLLMVRHFVCTEISVLSAELGH
ncbi:MAG: DUF481 domain-containing protein, partial [Lentisphaerota bacterium]